MSGTVSGSPPSPWTPQQWEAITRSGYHVLVSAAAGSGKTAVLVERIVRRITEGPDPVDIDRLLVVTFTDAAAGQMRRRIADALQEKVSARPHDERLRRQLALLPRASISTIHAACRAILRRYFHRIGLDPRFRLLDGEEAFMLQHDALDRVLGKAYADAEPGSPFDRLAAAMTEPEGDEALRRAVIELYDKARSLPDPKGWLSRLPGPEEPQSLDAYPWMTEVRRWIERELAAAARALDRAVQLAGGPGGVPVYLPTLEAEWEQIDALRHRLRDEWAQLTETFRQVAFKRLPPARGDGFDPTVKEAIQEYRREAVAKVRTLQGALFARSPEDHGQDLRRIRPYIAALVDLTLDFHRTYSRVKRERSLLDFSDLEHHCLALLTDDPARLTPSPVAEELQARFAEVLVDEYQDTNAVQDAIIQLVSGRQRPNTFLVGDVKQSIYRFRLAEPALFLQRHARSRPLPVGHRARASHEADPSLLEVPSRRPEATETHPAETAEARIDLNANFRSRRPIIDGVNFIFRQVMIPEVAEMAYDEAAELVYGASYPAVPTTAGPMDPPVEFHLVERDDDGENSGAGPSAGRGDTHELERDRAPRNAPFDPADLTAFEREATVVARRIRQLLDEPTLVWDGDAKTHRPIRPGDIAVLLRATRHKAPLLVDMLSHFGIPAYAELSTGYFAATEVDTMLALLALIENPRQDIPLAAVLRSPIVGLSAEDLARIRLIGDQVRGRDEGDGADGSPPDPGSSFYDAVVAVASLPEERDGDGGAPDAWYPRDLRRRLSDFLSRLDGWRTMARRRPLGDLVQAIYRETRFDHIVSALPGGRQREANLHALYDRARQFDQFHRQGLSRFLEFIRRLRAADGDLGAAPALGEDDDVVRVMSVHAAKGLEFPVAIVMDVGRKFHDPGAGTELFLFHRDLGAAAMGIDQRRRIVYRTLPYVALRERQRQEEMAEEMRILYVALTRARERLIITGTRANVPAACSAWMEAALGGMETALGADEEHVSTASGGPAGPLPAERLVQARSWLDWLGPALMRHPDASRLREAATASPAAAPPTDPPSYARTSRLRDSAETSVGRQPEWVMTIWSARDAAAPADLGQPDAPPLAWDEVAAAKPLAVAERETPAARSPAENSDDEPDRHGERTRAGEPGRHRGPSRGGRTGQDDGPEREGGLKQEDGPEGGAAVTGDTDTERVIRSIKARVAWTYPWRPVTEIAAKMSASELKRRWQDGDDVDGESVALVAPGPGSAAGFDRSPQFRRRELHRDVPGSLSPTERGSATHRALQWMDLRAPLDTADIAAQLSRMKDAGRLSPAEADAIDVEQLASFFASPLGRKIRAHARAGRPVWREVPFTLALPAGEIHPELPKAAAAGEYVLTQGVMDLLAPLPDGMLLVDFKTDRIHRDGARRAAERYRGQMMLYERAVREIYKEPVGEAYLVFLTTGDVIRFSRRS